MYFFEDSGGILPVHGVGVSAQGLVKGSGRLNLNWIAELSNGRSSPGQNPASAPVQIFASDRNHKAFNLAGYIKPDQTPGLQVGGSFYKDRLSSAGPHINQDIESFHVVFVNSNWEFLNEFVAERNRTEGSSHTSVTSMAYTQFSRKFGAYRPYVRYQYVNVAAADPLNSSVGRYNGPSAGLRFDVIRYAALKVQYNRVQTRNAAARNGVNAQLAFTF
jgi:hypothetical protein